MALALVGLAALVPLANATSPEKAPQASKAKADKVKAQKAKTDKSADKVLTASQAVEVAAENLREKVEGFLCKVAV